MKCENCGKEHDGNYGSGRFCSKVCARQFSSKSVNHSKLKTAHCKKCGKEIQSKCNSSITNVVCDECKNTVQCKVCGEYYDKRIGCKNDFCYKHNLQQLKSLIKYFGFDEKTLGTNKVFTEYERVRNILYDLYWNKQLSSIDITKKFNYPSAANLIGKIFKYLEIPSRTFKEASTNAWLIGNNVSRPCHNQYKQQWHTTWNNKEVFLRSSYELDYANELDKEKIDYDVENLKFKYLNTKDNEYHCAIPDFYIPSTHTIVEIKSAWTLDIQNMKDRFKVYKDNGYNCKLILEHEEIDLYSL